ncbi:hypothetical protein [Salinisphaera sp. T5B8]
MNRALEDFAKITVTVVFYRARAHGIFVIRPLHQCMEPLRHFDDLDID